MATEFVDGIVDVAVVGSTARLEFFLLRPDPRVDPSKGAKPELVRTPASVSIIMPVEALVNAIGQFERLRANLIESGAIKKREVEGGERAREEPQRQVSPNFDPKLRQ